VRKKTHKKRENEKHEKNVKKRWKLLLEKLNLPECISDWFSMNFLTIFVFLIFWFIGSRLMIELRFRLDYMEHLSLLYHNFLDTIFLTNKNTPPTSASRDTDESFTERLDQLLAAHGTVERRLIRRRRFTLKLVRMRCCVSCSRGRRCGCSVSLSRWFVTTATVSGWSWVLIGHIEGHSHFWFRSVFLFLQLGINFVNFLKFFFKQLNKIRIYFFYSKLSQIF
jgi:hypothetical protein